MTNAPLMTELEHSLQSGSQDKSADTLRRVTDLFLASAGQYSEQQLTLFDSVFARLVEKIETHALAELSDRLAPVDNAPPDIVKRLASNDAIEVAAPVLAQSSVLSDEDLIEIASTKSQDHLLAMSRRDTIAPPVTDILIERGDENVVHSVAANSGAEFSDAGYTQLMDKSAGDDVLAEVVASRNDVSLPGLHRLLARATKEVCARLLDKVKPDFKQDVHETLLRIFDRVDNDIHAQRDQALQDIRALHARGELDARKILEFATAQQLAQMTAGLSLLGDARFELIADIIDSGQNQPLMVVCKAAGLPWSTTFALLKSRPGQQDIVEFQFDQLLYDFCRLTPDGARRVLQFWHVKQPEKPGNDSEQKHYKKRSSPRSKIHQAAIVLAPGFEKQCMMLDISRGGAKMQIGAGIEVPDRFTVSLVRNRLIRRSCRVVWRSPIIPGSARIFGVCFDQ